MPLVDTLSGFSLPCYMNKVYIANKIMTTFLWFIAQNMVPVTLTSVRAEYDIWNVNPIYLIYLIVLKSKLCIFFFMDQNTISPCPKSHSSKLSLKLCIWRNWLNKLSCPNFLGESKDNSINTYLQPCLLCFHCLYYCFQEELKVRWIWLSI